MVVAMPDDSKELDYHGLLILLLGAYGHKSSFEGICVGVGLLYAQEAMRDRSALLHVDGTVKHITPVFQNIFTEPELKSLFSVYEKINNAKDHVEKNEIFKREISENHELRKKVKDHFHALIDPVRQKDKNQVELSPEEKQILDFESLIENFEIYKNRFEYTHLFPENKIQDNLLSIAALTLPVKAGDVANYNKIGEVINNLNVNKIDLESLLTGLLHDIKQPLQDTLVITIEGHHHLISFGLQPTTGKNNQLEWYFVDSNQLPAKFYSSNQISELSERIIRSFHFTYKEEDPNVVRSFQCKFYIKKSSNDNVTNAVNNFGNINNNINELCDRCASNNINSEIILQNKNIINMHNAHGLTPLSSALHSGNIDIARTLIKAGADINMINADETKPINILNNEIDRLEKLKLMVSDQSQKEIQLQLDKLNQFKNEIFQPTEKMGVNETSSYISNAMFKSAPKKELTLGDIITMLNNPKGRASLATNIPELKNLEGSYDITKIDSADSGFKIIAENRYVRLDETGKARKEIMINNDTELFKKIQTAMETELSYALKK